VKQRVEMVKRNNISAIGKRGQIGSRARPDSHANLPSWFARDLEETLQHLEVVRMSESVRKGPIWHSKISKSESKVENSTSGTFGPWTHLVGQRLRSLLDLVTLLK
jgi:hypothetical protein